MAAVGFLVDVAGEQFWRGKPPPDGVPEDFQGTWDLYHGSPNKPPMHVPVEHFWLPTRPVDGVPEDFQGTWGLYVDVDFKPPRVGRSLDDVKKEERFMGRLGKAILEGTIEYYRSLRSESPREIKMRTKGVSYFGCSTVLIAGSLSCLPLVGASSASTPGSSADHSTWFYVGITAAIMSPIIGAVAVGITIYHNRRETGGGVRGALDGLIRPFRERPSGMYMSVESLVVGEVEVNGLVLDSRV